MEFRCLDCGKVNAVSEDKIPMSKDGAFWWRQLRTAILGATLIGIVAAAGCNIDNWLHYQHLQEVMKQPNVKFEYEKTNGNYPRLKINRE